MRSLVATRCRSRACAFRTASTSPALSRGLDCAELFTDDAWKLAVQLRKATGSRVLALDGVALQAAHDTAFGVGNRAECAPGHAPSVTERGRETPSEHGRGSVLLP